MPILNIQHFFSIKPLSFIAREFSKYENWGLITNLSSEIVKSMIISPFNSVNGIHLCKDAPLGNKPKLNILRPGVLRQYFGINHVENSHYSVEVYRYSYGMGMGSACRSIGTEKTQLKTRPFNDDLYTISNYVHDFVFNDESVLHMLNSQRRHNTPIVDDKFNHLSILFYYGIEELKHNSRLGVHGDVCYDTTGTFIDSQNSQMENSLTVVLSLFDDRDVNFYLRKAIRRKGGKSSSWKMSNYAIHRFRLSHGNLFVLHPDDERPFHLQSDSAMLHQIHHGNIRVNRNQFSVAIVFRTVSNTQLFFRDTDLMITHESTMQRFYENKNKNQSHTNSMDHTNELHNKLVNGFFDSFKKYI